MCKAIESWLSKMTPKFLASVDGSTGVPSIEKGGGTGRAADCLDVRRLVLVTMMVLLGELSLTLFRIYQMFAFTSQEERELKADCCSEPSEVGLKLTLAWVSSKNWSTVTPVTDVAAGSVLTSSRNKSPSKTDSCGTPNGTRRGVEDQLAI